MRIENKKISDIINNEKLRSRFISIKHNNLNIDCNILKSDFYLDSFNYFPILKNFDSFQEIFSWGDANKYENFYKDSFYKNLINNKKNFDELSNIFVLGSSSVDNYYRNLITFLPRIFFITNKSIKIAIHRKSSNKFRNLILKICRKLNVDVQIIFLDNNFSYFKESLIPQFFSIKKSVKILNNITQKNIKPNLKLYIIRKNTSYRNIFNEWDVSQKFKKNGFQIIDLNNLEIWNQIELFSSAKTIVSATGSGLTNIVFCAPGTKVFEISPIYKFDYENVFKFRYKDICDELNLKHYSFEADSMVLDENKLKIDKIISKKILNTSNYYKNLLLKLEKVDEIIKLDKENN